MKTRAILLAAAAVFLTAPAFADPNDNQGNQDKKDQAQHQDARKDAADKRDDRADKRDDRLDARQDHLQAVAVDNKKRDDRLDARQDHLQAVAADNKMMERKITRENINEFRENATAARRFHYSVAWVAPHGWRYQRFAYGQHMPASYYGHNYWIVNFGGFGLYAPPQGYQWVRYGHDAVLVDLSTGEIIRVQYNNFY